MNHCHIRLDNPQSIGTNAYTSVNYKIKTPVGGAYSDMCCCGAINELTFALRDECHVMTDKASPEDILDGQTAGHKDL